MNTPNRSGYRGYISARMEMGRSTPQHIQQLVIRDYCAKRSMQFLLSATEYRMEGCTLILDAVLNELDNIEGIVMYSLYQMPTSPVKRQQLYKALFAGGCSLHCAAENIVIATPEDAERIEQVWQVADVIAAQTPDIFTSLTAWDKQSA